MINISVIIPLLFLFFSCQQEGKKTLKHKPETAIVVEYDSLYQTKYYSLIDSSGSYKFEVYLSDLNSGIIRYRYDGNTPLRLQIKSMRVLLDSVFQDSSLHIGFNTLLWGTLIRSRKAEHSMAIRLALAAANSQDWNRKLGKPMVGHENAFVRKLANSKNIYPELTQLFNSLGYKIEISGVEKVFILPAIKLSFWDEISDQVNSTDKLPYNCQTWFKIETMNDER